MRKIDCILIKRKSISERESEIKSLASFDELSPKSILEIRDILTLSMPSYIFIFRFFLGMDKNFHPSVKQGFLLVKVQNVEFHSFAFKCI